jgi:hypothetical protein
MRGKNKTELVSEASASAQHPSTTEKSEQTENSQVGCLLQTFATGQRSASSVKDRQGLIRTNPTGKRKTVKHVVPHEARHTCKLMQ